MSQSAPIRPIPFEPGFETPEDDEAQTSFDLQTTMRSISTKTYEDSGRALRSVHAKTHGLLLGEMVVEADLPAPYGIEIVEPRDIADLRRAAAL